MSKRNSYLYLMDMVESIQSILEYTIKKSNPEVEWRLIKDMRNKLIHEYFGIDHKIIYTTINKELPSLLEKVQQIISSNYSDILPLSQK